MVGGSEQEPIDDPKMKEPMNEEEMKLAAAAAQAWVAEVGVVGGNQ